MARTRRTLAKPWVILPALAIVGLAAWFGVASAHSTTATPTSITRSFTVSQGNLDQTVTSSGTVAAADTKQLNFAAAGTVTAVNVRTGDKVTTGEVLATLDSASLQNAVTQAQADLATAQAKLTSDQAAAATDTQLAADQTTIDSDQAALNSAQVALAGATITAPIDGTVSALNLTVGQQLGSSGSNGTSLSGTANNPSSSSSSSSSSNGFGGNGQNGNGQNGSGQNSSSSSSSTSTAQIEVVSSGFLVNLSVDDTQVGNLKAGQTATITPTNGTSTSDGTAGGGDTGNVLSVGTVATSTSGVSTFPVVIAVAGTPTDLYTGATAEVSVTYAQIKDAVLVSSSAIVDNNGQATATVVTGGSKKTVDVQTGITSNGIVQVLSGLKPGDQVSVTVDLPKTTTSTSSSTGGTNGRTSGTRTGGFGGQGGFAPGGGGFTGGPPAATGGN